LRAWIPRKRNTMVSLVHYFGLDLPISESPRCLSSAPAAGSVAIRRRKGFLDRMRRRCNSIRPWTLRGFSVDFLELIPTLNIQTVFGNQLEMRSITENNS
jgi:hypothetical protein